MKAMKKELIKFIENQKIVEERFNK